MMKKPDPLPQGAPQPAWTPPDGTFHKDFPLLYEIMTATRYECGTARETATMSCFIEAGMFKVQLRDRDAQRGLWRSGTCWETCWLEIEGALSQSVCHDWRPLQAAPGKKRR